MSKSVEEKDLPLLPPVKPPPSNGGWQSEKDMDVRMEIVTKM